MPYLTAPLVRKLESLGDLSSDERESIQAMPLKAKRVHNGEEIAREGDQPVECCLVIEGFVQRHSTLSTGQRQMLSFHVAGDIPDLQGLHLRTMDHTLSSVGTSTVAMISHADMLAVLRKSPRLINLFWRDSLIDAAVARAWIKVLGRHVAHDRFAHLLCEIYVRLEVVGLAKDNSCALPLTQTQLGEALGISDVHINRTLQKLRSEGLVEFKNRRLTVLDWEGLKAAAEFDPAYLNLREPITIS